MKNYRRYFLVLIFLIPICSHAEEENRRYRTLEERRDAGIKHQVTQWLKISPLVEFEYGRQRFIPADKTLSKTLVRENSQALQLEIIADPTSWMLLEIVYEYDDQLDELLLDEAVVEFEIDKFKLEAGRFTLPFGEYYSHFVTGPLLEFGEISSRALIIAWEPNEALEASIFIFKGHLEKFGTIDNTLDWGVSLNISPLEFVTVGFSYVSDVSESETKLLEDALFYQQRVDALSGFLNIEIGQHYDISLEFVQALNSFSELEEKKRRPAAWNIEYGFYPEGHFEWALRLEGSNELDGEPVLQAGIGLTWHIYKNTYLTAEVLQGQYKTDFVQNDADQSLDYFRQFMTQFVFSF